MMDMKFNLRSTKLPIPWWSAGNGFVLSCYTGHSDGPQGQTHSKLASSSLFSGVELPNDDKISHKSEVTLCHSHGCHYYQQASRSQLSMIGELHLLFSERTCEQGMTWSQHPRRVFIRSLTVRLNFVEAEEKIPDLWVPARCYKRSPLCLADLSSQSVSQLSWRLGHVIHHTFSPKSDKWQ